MNALMVHRKNNKNNSVQHISHEGARPRTPSQPNNLSQWRRALSHSGSHTSSESVSIFLLTLLTRSGFPASNCCLWKLNRVSHDTHKFVLQTWYYARIYNPQKTISSPSEVSGGVFQNHLSCRRAISEEEQQQYTWRNGMPCTSSELFSISSFLFSL